MNLISVRFFQAVPVVILLAANGMPSLAEVPGIMNYQGRVVVNGTNYDGVGQFKFALVDRGSNVSRQAAAAATLAGQFVVSCVVNDGGAGYVTPPVIGFSGGGGAGAAAYALVGGGAVTSIVVTNAGSGYTSLPFVSIAPPPPNMVYETYWSNGAQTVAIPVSKGLYAVLLGDTTVSNMVALPTGVFAREDVRLRVWFDGGSGLQQLTPDPRVAAVAYAMQAASMNATGLVGKIADTNLAANVARLDGAGQVFTSAVMFSNIVLNAGAVSNVNLSVTTLSNTFWRLDGNAGTTPGTQFIGTTDNKALEVKVNGIRALRIEPNSSGAPNMVGGAPVNFVSPGVIGATISGGGATNFSGSAHTNRVDAYFGTIGGGMDNFIQMNAWYSTICGGRGNTIQTNTGDSTICGGFLNSIQDYAGESVLGGGLSNCIQKRASYAFLGGGVYNSINSNAQYATLGGGYQNIIKLNSYYSLLGGGGLNTIETNITAGTLVGGYQNSIQYNADYSTLVGGWQNTIQADSSCAMIGGGQQNSIHANSDHATIGGGYLNAIQYNSAYSTLCGGYVNRMESNTSYSTICGGVGNLIQIGSSIASILGGTGNLIEPYGPYAVLGGGYDNSIQYLSYAAVLGGGYQNTIGSNASYSVLGGGFQNNVGGSYASVLGGVGNSASGNYSFAAGRRAKALHPGTFVWGDSTDDNISSTSSNQVVIRARGGIYINDTDIHFRLVGDNLHGLGFYGASKTFAGLDLNGPALYGNGGGALGSNTGTATNLALRWGQDGKVGIKRTAANNALEVEGEASKTTAGSWLANSDSRIKTDILAVTNALDVLDRVRLVSFRYTDEYRQGHPSIAERYYLNVVAQEFREVFPEYVKTSGEKLPDGSEILQVDTYPLTIYSSAAIQELNRRLQAEKARNDELERRIKVLESKL